MVMVDALTRWSQLCLLHAHKNRTFPKLLSHIIWLRTHHPDYPIKSIRVDNATEFTSKTLDDYWMNFGNWNWTSSCLYSYPKWSRTTHIFIVGIYVCGIWFLHSWKKYVCCIWSDKYIVGIYVCCIWFLHSCKICVLYMVRYVCWNICVLYKVGYVRMCVLENMGVVWSDTYACEIGCKEKIQSTIMSPP